MAKYNTFLNIKNGLGKLRDYDPDAPRVYTLIELAYNDRGLAYKPHTQIGAYKTKEVGLKMFNDYVKAYPHNDYSLHYKSGTKEHKLIAQHRQDRRPINKNPAKNKDIHLKGGNLYLQGFGHDRNGNAVIKLTYPNGRGFSLQIGDGLTGLDRLYTKNISDLTQRELDTIADNVVWYIQTHGSAAQKKGLHLYRNNTSENPKRKTLDAFEDKHLTEWIEKYYNRGDWRTVKSNILKFLAYSPDYDYGNQGWTNTVKAAEYVFDNPITSKEMIRWKNPIEHWIVDNDTNRIYLTLKTKDREKAEKIASDLNKKVGYEKYIVRGFGNENPANPKLTDAQIESVAIALMRLIVNERNREKREILYEQLLKLTGRAQISTAEMLLAVNS